MVVTAPHLRIARVRCAALAIGLACTSIGASAQAPRSAKDAVLVANGQFYAAVNAMFTGDVRPIEAIWSHASDVSYMGPGGESDNGWDAVLKNWKIQTARKLGGHVDPVDIHVIVGEDVAVVTDYEQGENTNANGRLEKVKLRATNTYRKEGGQWKMVGHHTDLLSYMAK